MNDWPAWFAASTPGVLYRHFDRDGTLLYVGSSNVTRYELRQDDHAKAARWWRFVVRIAHEQLPDRRAAYLAEFAAIRAERPIFNRTLKRLAAEQAARENQYLADRGVVAVPEPALGPDAKTLIEDLKEAESVLDEAQKWSGQLVAELKRRGLSWPVLARMTGIPQTNLARRGRSYLRDAAGAVESETETEE